MDEKRLKKILEIKEKQKKGKERELKIAAQELKIEQEKLKSLKKEIEHMEEILSDQIITSNLELYHCYLNSLSKKIDNKELEVLKKDQYVKDKEKELLQAYRETRALNIVKNNALKKELKKVIMEEQKEIDFDYITRKLKK